MGLAPARAPVSMNIKPIVLVVILAVGAIAAAWGLSILVSDPEPAEEVEHKQRIVSLMPPITETLYEIGAGDQLVGRSDWCEYPVAAHELPKCGSALTPNIEKIVDLEPELILSNSSEATARAKLSPLATSEFLPWLDAEDMIASVRKLGELTGHIDEATKLADELQAGLMLTPPDNAPRVLMVIAQDTTSIQKVSFLRKNSLHGQMLRAAGGVNAVNETVTGVPELSMERVIELDPDIILVIHMRDDITTAQRNAIISDWNRIKPLTAVQKSRVGVLSGAHFYGAGRRLLRAVEDLRVEIERLQP